MTAASGFIGVKPTTTPSHLVRAVLESIIFRINLAYSTLKKERNRNYKKIVCVHVIFFFKKAEN